MYCITAADFREWIANGMTVALLAGFHPPAVRATPMPNDRPSEVPPSTTNHAEASSTDSTDRLIYRSGELMNGRREIFIEHNRNLYRLRITSQGRLILTK
jgi:hemin uptake protein HemP